MRFFVNSNAEKKMAFTTQERLMETPKPTWLSDDAMQMKGGRRLTTIHARIGELNLGSVRFSSATDETVALVHALRRVNGKDLHIITILLLDDISRRKLTQAQLTSPQRPPAVTTARGVVGESPRALANSCFALS